jgi:DNA polymerase III epsilon subunit-like protein
MYIPTMKRLYNIEKGTRVMDTFREMMQDGNTVYLMSMDTTGLFKADFIPEAARIVVLRCTCENGKLSPAGTFTSFVKTSVKMPPEAARINGVKDEDIEGAPSIEEVFGRLYELMEPHANILGYNIDRFLKPMIDACGFRAGLMFYDAKYLDIMELAEAVLHPTKRKNNRHGLGAVLTELGLHFDYGKAPNNVNAYMAVFNDLFPVLPSGQEKAVLTEVNFWEKGGCRRVYLGTDRGRVAIDPATGCLSEETPGIFDVVDMNGLLEQFSARYGGRPVLDICRDKNARAMQTANSWT